MDKIKLIETTGIHGIFPGMGILKSILINKRVEDGSVSVKINDVWFPFEVFEPLKEFTQIDFKEVVSMTGVSVEVDTGSSVGISVIYRD